MLLVFLGSQVSTLNDAMAMESDLQDITFEGIISQYDLTQKYAKYQLNNKKLAHQSETRMFYIPGLRWCYMGGTFVSIEVGSPIMLWANEF